MFLRIVPLCAIIGMIGVDSSPQAKLPIQSASWLADGFGISMADLNYRPAAEINSPSPNQPHRRVIRFDSSRDGVRHHALGSAMSFCRS